MSDVRPGMKYPAVTIRSLGAMGERNWPAEGIARARRKYQRRSDVLALRRHQVPFFAAAFDPRDAFLMYVDASEAGAFQQQSI